MHNNGSKALFLDRDGVVNIDHGYISSFERFEFIYGVFEACLNFQADGYKIIIITNQSGIARGYFSPTEFEELTNWMCQQFAARGVKITAVYHCPHHPSEGLSPFVKDCQCRKPKPGLLLNAISEHGIDPNLSIMVGDRYSDILAAASAGVKHKVLVRSGELVCNQDFGLVDAIWPSLYDFAFNPYR